MPEPADCQELLQLADRLHSAAIHLLRRLRKQDESSGLPGAQLSALSVIVYTGPLSLGELARAEQVRPPTITRLVQGLEREGLVRRGADRHDRRVQRVSATARGRRLLEQGRYRRIAHLAAELGGLGETGLRRLTAALPLLERLARSA